jgi:hypothetical protein
MNCLQLGGFISKYGTLDWQQTLFLPPSQENQEDGGPFTLKLEGEHKLVTHVLDAGILVRHLENRRRGCHATLIS